MVGVGNRGSARAALERGMAFRVVGVGNEDACVKRKEDVRGAR